MTLGIYFKKEGEIFILLQCFHYFKKGIIMIILNSQPFESIRNEYNEKIIK